MNKLKSFFRRHRLNRPVHIALNVLLTGLLIFVIYIFKGSPALSDEMALRRTETEHLMGPGEILACVDTGYDAYPCIYAVDEGEGVALFTGKEHNNGYSSCQHSLYYRKKTGNITLMPEPLEVMAWTQEFDGMCIFAFDTCPKAKSAELTITLSCNYNGIDFSHDYTVTAQREYDGLFIFNLQRECGSDYTEREKYAFSNLADSVNISRSTSYRAPATIRFYDNNGELISAIEQPILSVSEETAENRKI